MTTQFDHPATPKAPPRRRPKPGRGLFRAFWRWHFYASFLVIPILLMLSVTGLIYLFRFQLEPLLHADLMKVTPPTGIVEQPYSAQEAAVARAYPDATIVSMTEPLEAGRSTVFSTVLADGSTRDIYVNPYGAEVLGDLNPDTTLSGTAVRLHGELMAGTKGDYLIELGACWAIVMALTGYYLFVKGRAARVRRRAAGAAGAVLRSRHALVGSFVGVSLLFLLVSGLPWTGLWGAKAQELATGQGTSMWSTDPGALSDPTSTLDESLPHGHAVDVPWALGDTEVPTSVAPEGEPRSVATLDTAIEVAAAEGLEHPMTVVIPAGDQGVYSAIGYAFHDPTAEKTVHVDRFGGQAVSTYGYDDYPALAKVVSQGIGIHEGRSFGVVNFWAAALSCLAIVFMCVSGPLMWWRRRPKGGPGARSLGAPRGRLPLASTPALAVGLVALGVFLPLFGISVLAVLLVDQLVLRRVPVIRTWFDVT